MRVLLVVSLCCLGSSFSFENEEKRRERKFVNSFVVTPERWEDRQGREIIEIIPDPTTVSTLSHYPSECNSDRQCETAKMDTTPMPTFKPYSQEELNAILKRYVQNNGKIPESATNKLANLYMDEPVNVLEGVKEKSKSWQMLQSQTQQRPYDDRNGWVTLEPVPWSASQIQKWEPNKRPPQIPEWEPPNPAQGQGGSQRPNRPWQQQDRPPWGNKPTYQYQPSKPGAGGWGTEDSWASNSDIITDNRPSSFPHSHSPDISPGGSQGRPWYDRPTDQHKDYMPGDGDGRWVLLSSTKGYGAPNRGSKAGRALIKQPAQLKSHRSVRLTVLPPIEGSANTTIAHGGLIEVEKGNQSVDESQREHAAKMLKLSTLDGKDANRRKGQETEEKKGGRVGVRRPNVIRVYPVKSGEQGRSHAVLAAVGAGMIPATMAMLLPMVLGRKRRSTSQFQDPPPSYHRLLHIPPQYYQQ